MRLALRGAEETLRRLQEASMMAGNWLVNYRLTAARAKLRQAERHFAESDQHDEPLKPLSPQVHKPRRPVGPKRRRYRCAVCFAEELLYDSHVEREPVHYSVQRAEHGEWERIDCGAWEPVLRMPARKRAV